MEWFIRRTEEGLMEVFVLTRVSTIPSDKANAILGSLIGAGTPTVISASTPEAAGLTAAALLAENERRLPPDEHNAEAIALTRTGKLIVDYIPLWSGDPRIQSIAIPKRLPAPGDSVGLLNEGGYTGQKIAKDEALKLAVDLFVVPGIVHDEVGREPRFSVADESSRAFSKDNWTFMIRPLSNFSRRSKRVGDREVKVLRPIGGVTLPNGWSITLGDYSRLGNGRPGRRDLKDLPPMKPFVEALQSIFRREK